MSPDIESHSLQPNMLDSTCSCPSTGHHHLWLPPYSAILEVMESPNNRKCETKASVNAQLRADSRWDRVVMATVKPNITRGFLFPHFNISSKYQCNKQNEFH